MKYSLNKPLVGDLEIEYLHHVIGSGWLGVDGSFTVRFEKEFAQLHGCKYAFAVQSGTAALHTAFWSVLKTRQQFPQEDWFARPKVAVPDYTCAATAAAVIMAGGMPVLVDVEEDTFGMDGELLEMAYDAAGHKLEAVALVHIYGTPARDTERIRDFCRMHGVKLIEDAAEAHGASLKGGQPVGSIGDVGTFSIRSDKAMGVGEGGVCVTNNEELMKTMRWFGRRCKLTDGWYSKYLTQDVGMNYSLPHLLGAVACAQMKRLPSMLKRRREIASLYRDMLPEFEWHATTPHSTAWRSFLRFPTESNPESIESIGESLTARGIEVCPGFWPLHAQPAFEKCPTVLRDEWVSDKLFATGMCVPSHPGLTDGDIEDICRTIQEVWQDANTGD